jgi:serine/threonine protein phosphatase PrpC
MLRARSLPRSVRPFGLGVPLKSSSLRREKSFAWLNLHQGIQKKDEDQQPQTTSYLNQSGSSKQDFVVSGETLDFKWLVVADGHGKSIVINCFRAIDWAYVVNLPSTGQQMADYICAEVDKLGNTSQSGATLTIVKIFPTHAEFYWAGDSTAKVYKNGRQIFQTKNHDLQNKDEVARVSAMGIKHKPCGFLTIKDEKTLVNLMDANAYFRFHSNFNFQYFMDEMNMTHAFGHNAASGKFLSKSIFEFTETAHWKIVVGSDGLWDMTCDSDIPFISNPNTTATNLGELAIKRWFKVWDKLLDKDGKVLLELGLNGWKGLIGNGDDVSVAVWSGFDEVKNNQLPISSSPLRMSSCPF